MIALHSNEPQQAIILEDARQVIKFDKINEIRKSEIYRKFINKFKRYSLV